MVAWFALLYWQNVVYWLGLALPDCRFSIHTSHSVQFLASLPLTVYGFENSSLLLDMTHLPKRP